MDTAVDILNREEPQVRKNVDQFMVYLTKQLHAFTKNASLSAINGIVQGVARSGDESNKEAISQAIKRKKELPDIFRLLDHIEKQKNAKGSSPWVVLKVALALIVVLILLPWIYKFVKQ